LWSLLLCVSVSLWPIACAYYPTPELEADALVREAGTLPSDRAIRLLDRAAELDPSRADILELRAGALADLGRREEAIESLSRALERHRGRLSMTSDLAALHLRRGVLLADLGRMPEAEIDFGHALRLEPSSALAYLHRAWARRRAGRLAEAEADLEQARWHGKSMAPAFHNAAVQHRQDGRLEEAERFFRFAVEVDPTYVISQYGLAAVLLEAGRFAEAEAALTAAIPKQPMAAELFHHRGTARLALKRFDEALADFTEAARLSPKWAEPEAFRGLVLQLGRADLAGADAAYTKALALDPACHPARLNRGLLYRDLGRLDEAERDLRAALSLRASAETARLLAGVLRERGDYDRAIQVCMRAFDLARDDAARQALHEEIARCIKAGKDPSR
ncbi:MAG TPA: tetratricopeptide repeat protein, partial [Planctomycetota bacterium]|nr:tetratricopeptide repeat protein [Planctomycetota bacterium]